jgi:hypothetical protein
MMEWMASTIDPEFKPGTEVGIYCQSRAENFITKTVIAHA